MNCSFCDDSAEIDLTINYKKTGKVRHCKKHFEELENPEKRIFKIIKPDFELIEDTVEQYKQLALLQYP